MPDIDNNVPKICQSWVDKVGEVEHKLEDEAKLVPEKCILPSSQKRACAIKKGEDSTLQRPRRERNSIRIFNLPKSVGRQDLERWVKPFGQTKKLFLARDKTDPNLCGGFAYAHFKNKEDGERAIQELNGYHDGDVILRAEWAEHKAQN